MKLVKITLWINILLFFAIGLYFFLFGIFDTGDKSISGIPISLVFFLFVFLLRLHYRQVLKCNKFGWMVAFLISIGNISAGTFLFFRLWNEIDKEYFWRLYSVSTYFIILGIVMLIGLIKISSQVLSIHVLNNINNT